MLLVETAQDILEVKAAVTGFERLVAELGWRVPVQAQVTLDTSGRMLLGTDVASAMTTLEALGVDTAFSHMEWFARPDGSVAVSEVGARPPGAQLASMIGLSHDVDFFDLYARLVLLDTFEVPERAWATGTAYLRGLGRGRVRTVHGLEQVQRDLGDLRDRLLHHGV